MKYIKIIGPGFILILLIIVVLNQDKQMKNQNKYITKKRKDTYGLKFKQNARKYPARSDTGTRQGRVASWHTINKKFVKIKYSENEN